MIPPRILIIDDQYATEADTRGSLCYQCGLVKIDAKTPDRELKELAAAEKAIAGEKAVAGAVFTSGQTARGEVVENSIEEVLKVVESGWPSPEGWRWALILLDVRFNSKPARYDDETFGLRVLEELVRRWPDREAHMGNSELPIVMLSTSPRQEWARDANQSGAAAYVEKDDLKRPRLQELLDEYGLIGDPSGGLIGRSHALLRVLRDARRVARMGAGNALILGPQGAGKSSIARYIHEQSGRNGLFVPYFSTPSAKELEYTNLFGYWYGAHSTALESAYGKAEEAHEGTLLIDEVHNLKSDTQQELLQFGRPEGGRRWLRRLGHFPTAHERVKQATRSVRGDRDSETSRIAVDVLMLSATNERLDDPDWRAAHGFSDPLYTRLAIEYVGRPLRFPGLAQRRGDIPELFEFFLRQETKNIGGRTEGGTKSLDADVAARLQEYSWPGNVAELRGVALEVARNSKDFTEVFIRHLPTLDAPAGGGLVAPTTDAPPTATANSLADVERILRNVHVPRSMRELQGRLSSIHDAYSLLVKEVLEAAFDEEMASKGPNAFITPALNLLFGDKMKATTAYGRLLSLARLFEKDYPPADDSPLAIAIDQARKNRNPHSRKGGKARSRKGGED
jgi:DNA-binding NtrC family response regulator